MSFADENWFRVTNTDHIPSPALLVYPERIQENVRRMLALAGGPARLRPHIKTHKMPEVLRLHLANGITKFKCATIAEAEMAAACGAPDVLLAYQPVGPNAARLLSLVQTFPHTRWSTIADDEPVIRRLSGIFAAAGATLSLLLDVDCGMKRCGLAPGPQAIALYRLMTALPGLNPAGLHAYDGTSMIPTAPRGVVRVKQPSPRCAHYETSFSKQTCQYPRSWRRARPRSPFTRPHRMSSAVRARVCCGISVTRISSRTWIFGGRCRTHSGGQQTGQPSPLPGSGPQSDRRGKSTSARAIVRRA